MESLKKAMELAAVMDERDKVEAKAKKAKTTAEYRLKLQRELDLLDAKIIRLMGGSEPRIYDRPHVERPASIKRLSPLTRD